MQEKKEVAILFNAGMIKGIRNGKTQTRRVKKTNKDGFAKQPYKAGDRLWVRETFAMGTLKHSNGVEEEKIMYRADLEDDDPMVKLTKWTPSIYMKKKHCRFWLDVKAVCLEDLNDIDFAGCIKEGIAEGNMQDVFAAFKELWNSINEDRGYGWNQNPPVWVVDFEVVK